MPIENKDKSPLYHSHIYLECPVCDEALDPNCIPNETCCDGYLRICNMNFECQPSNYWEHQWPSPFFASVTDIKNKGTSCCFKLTGDNTEETIQPSTFERYEFTAHDVKKCVCNKCHLV